METSTGGDDEKLFKATKSPVDCRKFQEVLTCADDWDKKSNITKYEVLSITRSRSPLYPVRSTLGSSWQAISLGIVTQTKSYRCQGQKMLCKFITKNMSHINKLRRAKNIVISAFLRISCLVFIYHSNNKIKLERFKDVPQMDFKREEGWHCVQRATAGSKSCSASIWRRDKGIDFFFKLPNGFYDLGILNSVLLIVSGGLLAILKNLLGYLILHPVELVLFSNPSLTALSLSWLCVYVCV